MLSAAALDLELMALQCTASVPTLKLFGVCLEALDIHRRWSISDGRSLKELSSFICS